MMRGDWPPSTSASSPPPAQAPQGSDHCDRTAHQAGQGWRWWTQETLPADWTLVRPRWSAFHTLRTFVSLGAVAAAVAAALTLHTKHTGARE
jgi:hypothetical protein